MMEITRNSLAVFLTESLVADLSVAAFGKIIAVYGQNSKIAVLPVIEGWILRTNLKKRHFARKPFLTH